MAKVSAYFVVLSTRAQKEITQAWEWYEERQIGLGDCFSVELIDKIKKISLKPERFPVRYKSYREALVSVFPYLIIFRISRKNKSIRIVLVFHASLNPKKKYQ